MNDSLKSVKINQKNDKTFIQKFFLDNEIGKNVFLKQKNHKNVD